MRHGTRNMMINIFRILLIWNNLCSYESSDNRCWSMKCYCTIIKRITEMNIECTFLRCLVPTSRRVLNTIHRMLILCSHWLCLFDSISQGILYYEHNFMILRFAHFLYFSHFQKKIIFELNFTLHYLKHY